MKILSVLWPLLLIRLKVNCKTKILKYMTEVIVEPIEEYGLQKKDRPKAMFTRVGIVGCGTTGQNIARMIASKGIEVIFLEINQKKIDEAFRDISRELDDQIDHWGVTESEKRAILTRITGTLDYADFSGCDLVIEAILSKTREQSVEIRKEVFRNIEKYVDKHTIIATNSSTLVITELASELENKDRCISLHFSTTAPDARIIEVAEGLYTSKAVCENVRKFAKLIGQRVIPVVESPGLISPRLFVALISESCRVLMENVATMEDIDLTMRRGFGLPLGPFEMADKIGLEKVVRWTDNLYNEFGDIKYKASPVLKRLVRANHLGRKTGEGFYKYDDHGHKITKDGKSGCK